MAVFGYRCASKCEQSGFSGDGVDCVGDKFIVKLLLSHWFHLLFFFDVFFNIPTFSSTAAELARALGAPATSGQLKRLVVRI